MKPTFEQTHRYVQFGAFALIAIGMPSTKVLMSIGLVIAIANWLIEGNWKEKWKLITTSNLLKALIVFYLLLIVGLIWSWDIAQGIKDIKSRLPLLALPLIAGTGVAMSSKQWLTLSKLFIASLFLTSVFNVLYYNQFFVKHTNYDIRGLSYFASHIRYGLLIVIGFTWAIWLQLKAKEFHLLLSGLALWFFWYNLYSQVLSAIVAMFIVLFVLSAWVLYRWKPIASYVLLALTLFISGALFFKLLQLDHEQLDCSKLPKFTALGHEYNHECDAFSEINGKTILAYYSESELNEVWSQRSSIDFMGEDKNGEMLRMTVARYMTAKGLTKDAKGFKQLTAEDIENIENGYTYPEQKNEFLMPRINGIKYQLLNNHDPNGHSLLQRIEHWKAAIHILKKNGIIGVGTGGNQKAFDLAYEELNSPLSLENRHRSHNMFLTYTISYGIFGLLAFLVLLLLIFKIAKQENLFSVLVFLIIFSSFFTEDTLETQLGVTIFGFFMATLIKRKQFDSEKN